MKVTLTRILCNSWSVLTMVTVLNPSPKPQEPGDTNPRPECLMVKMCQKAGVKRSTMYRKKPLAPGFKVKSYPLNHEAFEFGLV